MILNDLYEIFPEKEKEIGSGAFGTVYLCKNINTGQEYACKKISADNPKYIKDALIEVSILKEFIYTPFCVQIKDSGYDSDSNFYIVFELLGECLLDKKIDNIAELKNIAYQVLEGLKNIHEKGYVHLDLKVENILQTRDGFKIYKIIDFGAAINTKKEKKLPKLAQTRHYRAPEIMAKRRNWGNKVDIWSLGCILMELYTGDLLFNTHDTVEHFQLIEKLLGVKIFRNGRKKNEYVELQPPLSELVKEKDYIFLDFVKHCLEIHPEKRWSASKLLNHEFLKV